MSQLTDQDVEFVKAMIESDGDPNSASVQEICSKKSRFTSAYKPGFAAAQSLLFQGVKRLRPALVKYALGFNWPNNSGGPSLPQFFDETTQHFSDGRVFFQHAGQSAWSKLLSSGASPETAGFMDVVRILARDGINIDADMRVDGKKSHGSLLAALCSRGWKDVIDEIEKSAGRPFSLANIDVQDKAGSSCALENALSCGHGEIAQWLTRDNFKWPVRALGWAATGFGAPKEPSVGATREPSLKQRELGIRLASRKLGVTHVDARTWDKLSDPLKNQQHLALWLMAQGARAQAANAEPGDLFVAWGAKLAIQKDADWEAMSNARNELGSRLFDEPKRNFLGFGGHSASRLAAIEIWREADAALRERNAQRPPLGLTLLALEQSRFEQAEAALREVPEHQKIACAVSLLGLAKLGFWNMPHEAGVGEDSRHPLHWAGFKMAIAQAGAELLNRPIEGLGGLTLMAMCSALGYADACAALIHAGASVDSNPLTEAVSPLALAIRFGRDPIAWSLLNSGADALEGAAPSAFGFVRKRWAIHEALDATTTLWPKP